MALNNVEVPLYDSSGCDKEHKLVVNEFAGRIILKIYKRNVAFPRDLKLIVSIECMKGDLDRAWNAVKRYC